MRRKKKLQHKIIQPNDEQIQQNLKKLGMQNLAAIEEVNMFRDDNTVLHFENP